MGKLLSSMFLFTRQHVVLFLLILATLSIGSYMVSEWKVVQRSLDTLPIFQSAHTGVTESRVALESAVMQQVQRLSGAGVGALNQKIIDVNARIKELRQVSGDTSLLKMVTKDRVDLGNELNTMFSRQIELEILVQQVDYLETLLSYAQGLQNKKAAHAKLVALGVAKARTKSLLDSNLNQQKQLVLENPYLSIRWRVKLGLVVHHGPAVQFTKLKDEEKSLRVQAKEDTEKYNQQFALVTMAQGIISPTAFVLDKAKLDAVIAPLLAEIAHTERLVNSSILAQTYAAVQPFVLTAVGLIISAILVPVLIRTLFFYLLAPLASKRPAIVIDATDSGMVRGRKLNGDDSNAEGVISAVSRRLTLTPDTELLIHSAFTQSQPVGAKVNTQILFSWRYPITSIAAHLYMLKRFRSNDEAKIVVSSTCDPLDEVAIVDVPEGSAMVMQPRSLAGVMYRAGDPPPIQSHWRFSSLHAWLTLQLRYLSFHGPVTLVVRGCRGVSLEHAGSGRSVSQAATLGFSANAQYGTVRAEPFMSYLKGEQSLFQDCFAGPNTYYLYEETPRYLKNGKSSRNPFEAMIDAGLKVFGI